MPTARPFSDPTPDNVPPYMHNILWSNGVLSQDVRFMHDVLDRAGIKKSDTPKIWTRTKDIYRKYVAECVNRRREPLSPQVFGVAVRILCPGVRRVQRYVRGVRMVGYTLRSPWELSPRARSSRPKKKTEKARPITDEVQNDLGKFL